MNEDQLMTVKQFIKKREGAWPSESALREIILNAEWGQNNFQSAFLRIGRRVLIDTVKFWDCVNDFRKNNFDNKKPNIRAR